MISFKNAIKEWEAPFGETMIGYSALTTKACAYAGDIFVISYWNKEKRSIDYRSFDVGLVKIKGRWMVDEQKLRMAISEKILAARQTNRMEKTKIHINTPDWALQNLPLYDIIDQKYE